MRMLPDFVLDLGDVAGLDSLALPATRIVVDSVGRIIGTETAPELDRAYLAYLASPIDARD